MMTEDTLEQILTRHVGRKGALLPILHEVQAAYGHVSEDAMRTIAAALNLTRAEVYGVVSFYHDFRLAPEARPVLQVCRAEACQARGVEALVAQLPEQARVEIETVYCLGMCSVGPCAATGGSVHARLDPAKLDALIGSLS